MVGWANKCEDGERHHTQMSLPDLLYLMSSLVFDQL